MDPADAALIQARYAVLRARYSRVSTQQHLGRYQCMVWHWIDLVPRQYPLATYPHANECMNAFHELVIQSREDSVLPTMHCFQCIMGYVASHEDC